MEVCYNEDRPHSFIWNNGKDLYLFTFPDENSTFQDFFHKKKILQQMNKNEDKNLNINSKPIRIGNSTFNELFRTLN